MKRSAILAIIVGLALAITLFATHDVGRVFALLAATGWALLIPIALHLPQTVFSALGWQPLLMEHLPVRLLYRLRWVREAVNTLLPVAVGGDVVRVRLAVRRGVAPVEAIAASLVDIAVELVGQVVFTAFVVALLVLGPEQSRETTTLAWAATAAVVLFALAVIGAQRLGVVRLLERAAERWSAGGKWGLPDDLSGLHDQVVALYRQPRRLLESGALHLLSWLAGIFETYGALYVLGLAPTLREATIIEALGQAIRACGFLIPGALGVQEGGLILIGGLFGIVPPQALALSLVRRIRELALGLPGLALWHRMEAR